MPSGRISEFFYLLTYLLTYLLIGRPKAQLPSVVNVETQILGGGTVDSGLGLCCVVVGPAAVVTGPHRQSLL